MKSADKRLDVCVCGYRRIGSNESHAQSPQPRRSKHGSDEERVPARSPWPAPSKKNRYYFFTVNVCFNVLVCSFDHTFVVFFCLVIVVLYKSRSSGYTFVVKRKP